MTQLAIGNVMTREQLEAQKETMSYDVYSKETAKRLLYYLNTSFPFLVSSSSYPPFEMSYSSLERVKNDMEARIAGSFTHLSTTSLEFFRYFAKPDQFLVRSNTFLEEFSDYVCLTELLDAAEEFKEKESKRALKKYAEGLCLSMGTTRALETLNHAVSRCHTGEKGGLFRSGGSGKTPDWALQIEAVHRHLSHAAAENTDIAERILSRLRVVVANMANVSIHHVTREMRHALSKELKKLPFEDEKTGSDITEIFFVRSQQKTEKLLSEIKGKGFTTSYNKKIEYQNPNDTSDGKPNTAVLHYIRTVDDGWYVVVKVGKGNFSAPFALVQKPFSAFYPSGINIPLIVQEVINIDREAFVVRQLYTRMRELCKREKLVSDGGASVFNCWYRLHLCAYATFLLSFKEALEDGRLTQATYDALAEKLELFKQEHTGLVVKVPDYPYLSAGEVMRYARGEFENLLPLINTESENKLTSLLSDNLFYSYSIEDCLKDIKVVLEPWELAGKSDQDVAAYGPLKRITVLKEGFPKVVDIPEEVGLGSSFEEARNLLAECVKGRALLAESPTTPGFFVKMGKDEERVIANYSWDVTLMYGIGKAGDATHDHKKEPVFGLEWEMKIAKPHFAMLEYFRRYKEIPPVVFKADSSIRGSWPAEMVTAPMTLSQMRTFLQRFVPILEDEDFNVNESCGVHIHLCRKSLTPLILGRLLVFINKKENTLFIERMAGREGSRWAERREKNFSQAEGAEAFVSRKYEALNLGKKQTVELRIFASSDSLPNILYKLEFFAALYDWAKLPDRVRLKAGDFLSWLTRYAKRKEVLYPALFAELRRVVFGCLCHVPMEDVFKEAIQSRKNLFPLTEDRETAVN